MLTLAVNGPSNVFFNLELRPHSPLDFHFLLSFHFADQSGGSGVKTVCQVPSVHGSEPQRCHS